MGSAAAVTTWRERLRNEDLLVDALPPAVQRVWRMPAMYALVFVCGFVLSFAPVALIVGRDDVEGLVQRGRADEALALLARKGQLDGHEQLWKGHAHYARAQTDAMLLAYQAAAGEGVVDDDALARVLDALGGESTGPLAVRALEKWPASSLDSQLRKLVTDSNWRRRHGAWDALKARKLASTEEFRLALVQLAVTDLGSETCLHKLDGLRVLAAQSDKPEMKQALQDGEAWDAVDKLDAVALARFTCLAEAEVRATLRSLAPFEKH